MSPEESDHFAKTTPENIIPTNMLDKWKLQDDDSVAAKSRSVLVGWKDPVIYQSERAAPTPTQEGIMVTLQWLASAKVTGRIADLTNAFDRLARHREKQTCHETATRSDSSKSGTRDSCCVLKQRSVGLCQDQAGPRASLTVDLLAAGYVKNPYGKCLFTLFSSDETS